MTQMLHLSHVDIVHMDVQAHELEVVLGAARSIKKRKIDYFIISTHRPDLNTTIRGLLYDDFECMANFVCRSGVQEVERFPKPVNIPQDGILILRRKGIDYSVSSQVEEGRNSSWVGSVQSPFPLIPELKKIDRIQTLQEAIACCNATFKIIPWIQNSFKIEDIPPNLSVSEAVYHMYGLFSDRTSGGWCGLSVEFFQRVLSVYGVKLRPFNYGTPDKKFTHITTVVEFDGKEYLLDPYFGKHYQDSSGRYLTLQELLYLIQRREFNSIVPVYEQGAKMVDEHTQWTPMNGEQFEETILEYFYHIGLKKALQENWECDNPLVMLLNEYCKDQE